jgi:hypothetical protein
MTKNEQYLKFAFLYPEVHSRGFSTQKQRLLHKEKKRTCHQNPGPAHITI